MSDTTVQPPECVHKNTRGGCGVIYKKAIQIDCEGRTISALSGEKEETCRRRYKYLAFIWGLDLCDNPDVLPPSIDDR